jgi:hypothetical protein
LTTDIQSESTNGGGVTTIVFKASGGGQTVFVQNVEQLTFADGVQTNPPGFPTI